MYVLVTGPPAAGKSYVARLLADQLGLPLLVKDTIKDALVETLDATDVEVSRRLGRAAVAVLRAVADDVGSGVLDSVWVDREQSREQLRSLPGALVEVFCRCDLQLMQARYRTRARDHRPGSFDLQRSPEELWPESALEPLAGPWPVIEVDTAEDVSAAGLAEAVARLAGDRDRSRR